MNQDREPFLKAYQTLIAAIIGGVCVLLAAVLTPLASMRFFPGEANVSTPTSGPLAFAPTATDFLTVQATDIPPPTSQSTPVPPTATMAQPTLALPTATPVPPSLLPVFEAVNVEFTAEDCPLFEGENNERKYECVDGEYRMLHYKPNTNYAYFEPAYDDAVIEAEGHYTSGTGEYEYGIVWRADQEATRYYVFTVTGDGQYNVSRYENEEYTELTPYTTSPAVHTGQETNKFKIIVRANQFDFYLNDQYLSSVTDETYASGYVGLFFVNASENVEIAFDWVRIATFEPTK